MDANTWIEDGTAEAEPVTTETPEALEAEAAEVVETAAAEVETVEPVEETVVEEVQAFTEGRLGDEVFQIPDGLMVPQKHGDETEYVDLAEVLKLSAEAQSSADILAEVQRERSAFGRDKAAHARQVAMDNARAEGVATETERIRGALSDPEKARQFEQHLHSMQTDPEYKALHERDQGNRETQAELTQMREERLSQATAEGVEKAHEWLRDIGKEFPGVDIGRVAERYGQELNTLYDSKGDVVREAIATLSPEDVRRIYESEAAYLSTATGPLETRMEALAAKFDALVGSQAAETHNETTQHAVARAKTTPVNTGAAAPALTKKPVTKFGTNELQDRNQAWVNEA